MWRLEKGSWQTSGSWRALVPVNQSLLLGDAVRSAPPQLPAETQSSTSGLQRHFCPKTLSRHSCRCGFKLLIMQIFSTTAQTASRMFVSAAIVDLVGINWARRGGYVTALGHAFCSLICRIIWSRTKEGRTYPSQTEVVRVWWGPGREKPAQASSLPEGGGFPSSFR